MKEKHALITSILFSADMGLREYLFAPRKDHRGWSTPSEAARLYFLLLLLIVGLWSWPITNGSFSLWLGLVFFVSTPLLTIGWWLISLVSQNTETRVLVDSLHRIDRSKKQSLHLSSRKP